MRFLYNIIYFLRYRIKYFFQRLFRGYGDPDVWALNYYICKKSIKPLKALRKNVHGSPIGITFKEWKQILDKIIYSMEVFLKEDHVREKEVRDRVQEGFELFGKYFQSLWN